MRDADETRLDGPGVGGIEPKAPVQPADEASPPEPEEVGPDVREVGEFIPPERPEAEPPVGPDVREVGEPDGST